MNLISLDFALFFLAVLVLYAAGPKKLRPGLLLAASLVFYGWFRWSFLALLLAQAATAYGCALWLAPPGRRRRKLGLAVSIGLILAPLFVFKYLDFVLQTLAPLLRGRPAGLPGLLLPLGISFYTFKSLSYLIDVYRGRIAARKNPILVGLYISFFPQILAGPIERAGNFLTQLEKDYVFDLGQVGLGLRRVVWGLFKKLVIADRLAQYVNIVFDQPAGFADLSLVAGLVFYAFQIYCDFSGYSDIAIGLAQMMGLETMENFRFPYTSRSIVEFWSRWHISLSTWLRDYLFLPISYAVSRRIKAARVLGVKTEFVMYLAGMATTMLLCGLWHGANWTFVVWGGMHGLYLIVSRATKRVRVRALRGLGLRPSNPILSAVRVLFTFGLTTFAWVFFRSPSLSSAWRYLGLISLRLPRRGVGPLIFLGSLLVLFVLAEFFMKNRERFFPGKRLAPPVQVAAMAFFVCLIIILAVDTTNEFLYFQF
jgi:alginate O-acetyltransferase complex protein AlgI